MPVAQEQLSVEVRPSTAHDIHVRFSLLIVIALWAVIYIPTLFSPALLDDADSVHAEAAREMVMRGDWVTLYANGVRYLEKAPLMYWGIATSYKLFGVSEWTTRLPLALGMLSAMLAMFAFGRRFFGDARAGMYAAIIIATGFGPFVYTRFTIPEIIVALWLTLGMHCFLNTLEEPVPSRKSCWGLAATAALGVLTKGLIGVVFPIAIIGVYLLITRNLRHVLRLRILSSTLVFLAVAAPWHILAGLRNPAAGEARGFFWFYFINEHVLRYLGMRYPKDYDTVPLFIFWALVVAWIFPWTIFLVQALGQIPRRWRDFSSHLDRRQRAALLCGVWAVVIVAFFSFSTRQEYYTIPATPPLALLIGAWLVKEQDSAAESTARKWGRVSSIVWAAIGVIVFTLAALTLWQSKAPHAGYDLADLLTKNPDKYALSLGHMFDLTDEAMGVFRVPLAMVAVAFLLGPALNWWFRRRNRAAWGNAALTVMMIVVLFAVHSAFSTFGVVLSSRHLAEKVKPVLQPADVLVIDGELESGSTMVFYTGKLAHLLNGRRANMWYGSLFPDAPKIFDTDDSFRQLWTSGTRVFFWSDKENPGVLAGLPARVFATGGGKKIWVNF